MTNMQIEELGTTTTIRKDIPTSNSWFKAKEIASEMGFNKTNIHRLVKANVLEATGKGKNRRYKRLNPPTAVEVKLPLPAVVELPAKGSIVYTRIEGLTFEEVSCLMK